MSDEQPTTGRNGDDPAMGEHDGPFICDECDTVHDFDGLAPVRCPSCLEGRLGVSMFPVEEGSTDE